MDHDVSTKEHKVQFRITGKEKKDIEKLKKAGISISELCRAAIREKKREIGINTFTIG